MTFLTSRRGFLAGLGSLLVAAPAVVRAEILMPVRSIERLIVPSAPLIGPYSFDSFDPYVPAATQYQWVTKTVMGEAVGNLDAMLKRGWRVVPPGRHRGDFNINGDCIEHGGCVLVEKPAAEVANVHNESIAKALRLPAEWMKRTQAQGFDVEFNGNWPGKEYTS